MSKREFINTFHTNRAWKEEEVFPFKQSQYILDRINDVLPLDNDNTERYWEILNKGNYQEVIIHIPFKFDTE